MTSLIHQLYEYDLTTDQIFLHHVTKFIPAIQAISGEQALPNRSEGEQALPNRSEGEQA
jgi:hypothetical protein